MNRQPGGLEPTQNPPAAGEYTCPMHPEIRQGQSGACPKCGMALEPVSPPAARRSEYVCPMHPEIVRNEPGSCPICGMALEARTPTAGDEEQNAELIDMRRRFWISLILSAPVLISAMGVYLPGGGLQQIALGHFWTWFQLALATPVVFWCGWPFFVRGWRSIVNRRLNMFTLIGWRGGGVRLQPGRGDISGDVPGVVPDDGRSPVVFRSRGGDRRRWCCWGRCWSCGLAAGPGPRSRGCSGWRPARRGIIREDGREEDSPTGAGAAG